MKTVAITHMPVFGRIPASAEKQWNTKDLILHNVSKIELISPIDVFEDDSHHDGIWAISAVTFCFSNENSPSLMILGTHEASVDIRELLDDLSPSRLVDLRYHDSFVKLLHELCTGTFNFERLHGFVSDEICELLKHPIYDANVSLKQLQANIDQYQLWMRICNH